MYPAEIVNPMKEVLTSEGFEELLTVEAVDELFKKEGTSLIVINSVCGCSASTCRPGAVHAIKGEGKKPTRIATSFAGFDIEAVKQIRTYLMPYPPSSPSIALIKDGQLVHFIERHNIEGRSADMIAANLQAAFNEFCD